MSHIALIVVDGVLSQGGDLRSSPPQKWALPMYEAIRSQFRTIAVSPAPEDITRWWLRKSELGHWSGVTCWNQVVSYSDWKLDQIRDFLANGWDLAFLLDNDRDVTAAAQSMGVLTLTIGPPLHHPGWKAEDSSFRPWEELVDTLDPSP